MATRRARIRVGDIFEIPLSDGRRAYAQYVFADKKQGPLIQVFDLITTERIPVERLKEAHPLFPPIIVGIGAAVKHGLWTVIGHMAVEDFVYPGFIGPRNTPREGKVSEWFLWDGQEYKYLGRELPDEYRHLELLMGWSPQNIPERIETGKHGFEKWLEP